MIKTFKKLVLILGLILVWNSAYACIVSGGVFYHPLSEVKGELVDSKSYYRKQFAIDEIRAAEDKRIRLTKEYEGGSSVLIKVEIPLTLANKPTYLSFEDILEVEIKEQKRKPEFETKSVFSVSKIRLIPDKDGGMSLFVKQQAFSTKYRIGEESLLLKIRGKVIANNWAFSVVIKDSETQQETTFAHNYISGEVSPCGARIVHVKSLERAKELDAARTTGFYQYTDKP